VNMKLPNRCGRGEGVGGLSGNEQFMNCSFVSGSFNECQVIFNFF
jgi:hypothetical protein